MSANEKMVRSPDGTRLWAAEWGNADGKPVVLIHGFCQSHLSWKRQYEDPALARSLRMIAFDFRGHGDSDAPDDAAAYQDARRWADDVAAVIEAFGAEKPILCGWSYGGRLIADYVAVHGDGGISGIVFAGARSTESDNPAVTASGPGMADNIHAVLSDDEDERRAGTRRFIRGCVMADPGDEVLDWMLEFNMRVSAPVRRAMRTRTNQPASMLSSIGVPVHITHGVADAVVPFAAAEHLKAGIPHAKLSAYENIGHAPFWEDAARFNRELLAFAETV